MTSTTSLVFSDVHLDEDHADAVFRVLYGVLDVATSLNITQLTCLGDFYHFRYAVPVSLQNRVKDWLDEMASRGHRLTFLPGNHDQEDVAGRNALEVFDMAAHVEVKTNPGWDASGLWLPFRRDPTKLVEFIRENPRPQGAANVAWLHHGIVGALMNDHRMAGATDGLDPAALATFDVVFAGHWHRHQRVANAVYVGSPWQTRKDEANQEKGVLLVDDSAWTFRPINLAPRHHRVRVDVGQPAPCVDLRPGDIVHVDGDDASAVAAFVAAAPTTVDVRVAAPKQTYDAANRLGLGAAASIQEYASRFAREKAAPEDLENVLRTFTFLASPQ